MQEQACNKKVFRSQTTLGPENAFDAWKRALINNTDLGNLADKIKLKNSFKYLNVWFLAVSGSGV